MIFSTQQKKFCIVSTSRKNHGNERKEENKTICVIEQNGIDYCDWNMLEISLCITFSKTWADYNKTLVRVSKPFLTIASYPYNVMNKLWLKIHSRQLTSSTHTKLYPYDWFNRQQSVIGTHLFLNDLMKLLIQISLTLINRHCMSIYVVRIHQSPFTSFLRKFYNLILRKFYNKYKFYHINESPYLRYGNNYGSL